MSSALLLTFDHAPKRHSNPTVLYVALQLNDLQNLIDDGEVGSAVRAFKHLHVMQKIFQERIERSQDDDDFNLSKQARIYYF